MNTREGKGEKGKKERKEGREKKREGWKWQEGGEGCEGEGEKERNMLSYFTPKKKVTLPILVYLLQNDAIIWGKQDDFLQRL